MKYYKRLYAIQKLYSVKKSHPFQINPKITALTAQICYKPVSEFNEFEPRLKSAINRFQLSAGLNREKFNTILRRTNHI